ncbi:hypothetical protein HPB48_018606 [Haemaphysalis longicornis]|uniref:Sine oculis-binding protein n=1 Tax=Haemaphysalis longicornis TaxID=44386 RepID=A0A9J6GR70_HAELO|nr:hypothetical protein HPB48_018606 [Haemaphysalis longicornis]
MIQSRVRERRGLTYAFVSIISADGANLPPTAILCAWCQKVGMKLFTAQDDQRSKAFCSELCFTQCRRASFKKNKVSTGASTCATRSNYDVDFQDGEQQLQFCSDKCLNQYKDEHLLPRDSGALQMHTRTSRTPPARPPRGSSRPSSGCATARASRRPPATDTTASSEREDDTRVRWRCHRRFPRCPRRPPSSLGATGQGRRKPSPDSGTGGDPVNLSKRQRTASRPQEAAVAQVLNGAHPRAALKKASLAGLHRPPATIISQQHREVAPRTERPAPPPSSSPGGVPTHHLNGHRSHTPGSPPPLAPLMPPLTLPCRPGPLPEPGGRPFLGHPHPAPFHMFPPPLPPHMRMHPHTARRRWSTPSAGVPPTRPFLAAPPGGSCTTARHGSCSTSGTAPTIGACLAGTEPLLPPPTVMVPYPIFVPIPIPIPIPIPLPLKSLPALQSCSSSSASSSTTTTTTTTASPSAARDHHHHHRHSGKKRSAEHHHPPRTAAAEGHARARRHAGLRGHRGTKTVGPG